jgi:putative flippase GtrA
MSAAVSGRASALSLTGMATFLRHQAGALIVTTLDFAVMSLCVRLLGWSAVTGTVLGALTGGVTNFILARRWIFVVSPRARGARGEVPPHERDHETEQATQATGGQALRYASVSLASLVLNAVGEYLLHDRLGIQFQIARAIVAATVSVAWNFPMHRSFVFPSNSAPSTP